MESHKSSTTIGIYQQPVTANGKRMLSVLMTIGASTSRSTNAWRPARSPDGVRSSRATTGAAAWVEGGVGHPTNLHDRRLLSHLATAVPGSTDHAFAAKKVVIAHRA